MDDYLDLLKLNAHCKCFIKNIKYDFFILCDFIGHAAI